MSLFKIIRPTQLLSLRPRSFVLILICKSNCSFQEQCFIVNWSVVNFVCINVFYAPPLWSELHFALYYEQKKCNKGLAVINEIAGVILSCHSLLNWMWLYVSVLALHWLSGQKIAWRGRLHMSLPSASFALQHRGNCSHPTTIHHSVQARAVKKDFFVCVWERRARMRERALDAIK